MAKIRNAVFHHDWGNRIEVEIEYEDGSLVKEEYYTFRALEGTFVRYEPTALRQLDESPKDGA